MKKKVATFSSPPLSRGIPRMNNTTPINASTSDIRTTLCICIRPSVEKALYIAPNKPTISIGNGNSPSTKTFDSEDDMSCSILLQGEPQNGHLSTSTLNVSPHSSLEHLIFAIVMFVFRSFAPVEQYINKAWC